MSSTATSTRPYLMRAIYEWCVDNGFTPFISVAVDEHTIVPREHVRDGEIVLNIGTEATNRLSIGNDLVTFQARFSGAVRELSVPIENVSAIYARENGHGLAFDVPKETGSVPQPKPTATPPSLGAMMAVVSLGMNAAKPEAIGSPVVPLELSKPARPDRLTSVVADAAAIDEEPKPPDGNGSGPDSGGQPRQRGRAKLTRIK